MSFLNIFKKIIIDKSHTKGDDLRKAECPYCLNKLNKIPAAKTKCPNCGKYIFVRTRPKDNSRVVVTKNEADKIEEDWAQTLETHDYYIAEKEKIAEMQRRLHKKFGKEPSDHDVRWGILNKDLLSQMQSGDWAGYRMSRFYMAEILKKELRSKQALQFYLEVCYIDLIGFIKIKTNDPDMLSEIPKFDPEHLGFLAPAVIRGIKLIVEKLELSKNDVKEIYIDYNNRMFKIIGSPLEPCDTWKKLEKEI